MKRGNNYYFEGYAFKYNPQITELKKLFRNYGRLNYSVNHDVPVSVSYGLGNDSKSSYDFNLLGVISKRTHDRLLLQGKYLVV